MKDEEILKEVLKDYVAGEDYEFRCGIEKAITLKGQAEAQKLQKIKEELLKVIKVIFTRRKNKR
jgi:hypothetical protein